ncbi:MAG: UPF0182 family protein [Deltaproteobacteria bacterium]|nr:UPF0182 family protein [Deltaproteobacteria bacterium]
MNQRSSVWLWTLLVLIGLTTLLDGVAWMVDWLWFESEGYLSVFQTIFQARWTLGLAEGLVAFVFLYGNFLVALRHIGDPAALVPPEVLSTPFGRWFIRSQFKRVLLSFTLMISLLLGLAGAESWQTWMLFLNGPEFGQVDPVFGKDISFYVFTLPWLDHVRGMGWVLGILAVMGTGFLYFLKVQGERLVQRQQPGVVDLHSVSRPSRVHMAVLGGGLLLWMAMGDLLDRYALMYSQHNLYAGPGYADIHGTIPLQYLKALVSVVSAGLLGYGLLSGRPRMLIGALGLLMTVGIGSGLYVTGLQRFVVDPNATAKEAPYLAHHIQATNQAFALDQVEERSLKEGEGLTSTDLRANAATLNNVRLWDHDPLLDTFSQIQEIRTQYEFMSVDNDRYRLGGELRQTMLSPRELQKTALPSRTWVNERITFTHGYGVTLGPVNRVNEQGLPVLFVKDIPPQTKYPELAVTRPEIYFGELVHDYVFVKTRQPEFDYPEGETYVSSNYHGTGGVVLDSFWKRLLLAVRLKDMKILLADDFTPETRILMVRNAAQRIEAIAPFFEYDSDPYLVVHQGRLVWVFDVYTTTRRYPYSRMVSGVGNYMRNPVKATVDAYDGTVTFYVVDSKDPITQGFAQVFPGLLKPVAQMPEGLRAHLRHPEGYFSVQAGMYATYHMHDPVTFYNKEDQWEIPVVGQKRMDPYYTVMKLPGGATEEFILMIPFTPQLKDNLAAWMAARSDGANYGKLVVYRFPKQSLVYGPRQMVARINQDPLVSQQLTLWDQSGSSVIRGTLLVIPINNSLVYIQPIYLKAEDGRIPELKRVIAGYQNDIAMGVDLEDALNQIFSGKRKATALEATPQASGGGKSQQALRHYEAMERAARAGDWAKYGEEQRKLGEVLKDLAQGKK